MKTFVNHKTAVDFEIQTFLFAFSVVMHIAASAVAASHPLLGIFLELLEIFGWTCILLSWVIALIKGIQQWGPKIWTRMWTFVRMHVRVKKAQKLDAFVSVEQLGLLRNNVQRLGLALHGLTPEMETARRTHFQMLGEALPSLILPPQNALLSAEFESLVKLLNHFGFPSLESVQLPQKDFEFVQQWGQDLEARLLHSHTQIQNQQQAMHSALSTATQVHQSIGTMYPAALNDAGYQRIQGALKLLKKMAQNSHCPSELVASYIPALQHDMDTLLTQLQQAAA
jgi:hypothetical protein